MNTLRVWGGGIFYPSTFYDACDEAGVMVYHDMAYASLPGTSHGPLATPTQDAELRHQIRRLSHHPAIVLWDGNNEQPVNMWQPSGLYATFVMTVVAQEDQSRAVWPSSPARGWATGVHRLYQTPNWDSLQGLFTQGGGTLLIDPVPQTLIHVCMHAFSNCSASDTPLRNDQECNSE